MAGLPPGNFKMGESSRGGVAADFGRVVEGGGGGRVGREGGVVGDRGNAGTNSSGNREIMRKNYQCPKLSNEYWISKIRLRGPEIWRLERKNWIFEIFLTTSLEQYSKHNNLIP